MLSSFLSFRHVFVAATTFFSGRDLYHIVALFIKQDKSMF
jgi:hypothetical protein